MKISILLAVLLSISSLAFSQNYLDEIASKSCECLNNVSDTLEAEQMRMEAGLCMLAASEPYKKQLKKDYDIDFNNIETDAENLGRLIGLKMASTCPEALVSISKMTTDEDVSEKTFEGHITAVNNNTFVEFSVKDNTGKISKFFWFTFIESNIELSTDYKKLVDKFVKITFISQEFFDARIGEYREFSVIQKLEILEE